MRARHIIELREGVRVEVLFTPSLFAIGKQRGVRIEIADKEDAEQIRRAYVQIIYLAMLNAWEAKRYDDPEMGDCPHKFIDIEEWAATHPAKYLEMVSIAFECMTGKSLKEVVQEKVTEVKKKSSLKRTTTK